MVSDLPTRPIRLAVIEDQAPLRTLLTDLIARQPGVQSVSTFCCMEAAIEALVKEPVDVALVDLGLPGMSGVEGIRRIKALAPGLQVLVLTVHSDNEHVFEALCAGASGYLLKTTTPEQIMDAVWQVMAGGSPMTAAIARKVVELFRRYAPAHAEGTLSPQEMRVLSLLSKGHQYKTAAGELGVSVHTVSFHLRNIYGKLQVRSKSEAVAKAIRAGWIR